MFSRRADKHITPVGGELEGGLQVGLHGVYMVSGEVFSILAVILFGFVLGLLLGQAVLILSCCYIEGVFGRDS